MAQGDHERHDAPESKGTVSVRKISRAEIDQILRDAIRRDRKYFRLPDRSNGQGGGQAR